MHHLLAASAFHARLQDVSLTVPAGTSCAVVGTSGSGKSTLLRLLFRFYDPSAGTVRISGHDLKELTMQSFRARVGSVPQVSRGQAVCLAAGQSCALTLKQYLQAAQMPVSVAHGSIRTYAHKLQCCLASRQYCTARPCRLVALPADSHSDSMPTHCVAGCAAVQRDHILQHHVWQPGSVTGGSVQVCFAQFAGACHSTAGSRLTSDAIRVCHHVSSLSFVAVSK